MVAKLSEFCWIHFLLIVLLAGGALAGCVDGGASAPSVGESVTGSWTLNTEVNCQQNLWLGGNNNFFWQVEFQFAGLSSVAGISGSYTGNGLTDFKGEFQSRFIVDDPVAPMELVYCAQWQDGESSVLPFAAVAQASGLDPGGLIYRVLYVPGLGPLYVGSDGQDAARFGMYLDGSGDLHGFLFSDHVPPPVALFHRHLVELISSIIAYPGLLVLNLPQRSLSTVYQPPPSGSTVAQMLLSVNAAVDVTFSGVPGAQESPCRFELYDTPDFIAKRTQQQLDPLAATQTVAYNPGDATQDFSLGGYVDDGQTRSAFLLPLAISTTDGNSCSAQITAREMASRFVSEREANGGFPDAFTLSLGAGGALVPGSHETLPGGWLSLPLLAEGAAWEGLVLSPIVVRSPAPRVVDLLGLADTTAAQVNLSLSDNAGLRVLNLFPGKEARQGLGPFQEYRIPADAISLPVPTGHTDSFSVNEASKVFRFKLASQTRVEIFSQGIVDLIGALRDTAGRLVAKDEHGAPDGMGFRIIRTLPAGSYDLTVSAPPAGGAFTLTIQPGPAPLVADENLEACLISAGLIDQPLSGVRRLVCPGRGITDLNGIGALANLTRLSLAGNQVTDLSPLQGLTRLHSLSLAGNPVKSLNSLTTLPSLNRLSLARTVLTPTQLNGLLVLQDRLSLLILEGARGITDADASALKAGMSTTVVVAPSGNILN